MRVVLYIAAYILPAAAVWSILSVVFWPLSSISITVLIPFMAMVYAFAFGVFEALGLPFRAPSLAWQVPSQWISGHSRVAQTITWGAILGPGLVTRNPYAGIWLLPLLLALNHSLLTAIAVGIAVGIAHAAARAIGVLSNLKYMDTNHGYILVLGAQLRWLYMDGLALLLAAGALTAYTLMLLGIQF